MDKQVFCQGCDQEHRCAEMYRRLGESRGPSVVLKVITAFLLPIVVFIVSFAVFERLLAGGKYSEGVSTFLSFVAALGVVFAAILIVRVFERRFGKIR